MNGCQVIQIVDFLCQIFYQMISFNKCVVHFFKRNYASIWCEKTLTNRATFHARRFSKSRLLLKNMKNYKSQTMYLSIFQMWKTIV